MLLLNDCVVAVDDGVDEVDDKYVDVLLFFMFDIAFKSPNPRVCVNSALSTVSISATAMTSAAFMVECDESGSCLLSEIAAHTDASMKERSGDLSLHSRLASIFIAQIIRVITPRCLLSNESCAADVVGSFLP